MDKFACCHTIDIIETVLLVVARPLIFCGEGVLSMFGVVTRALIVKVPALPVFSHDQFSLPLTCTDMYSNVSF